MKLSTRLAGQTEGKPKILEQAQTQNSHWQLYKLKSEASSSPPVNRQLHRGTRGHKARVLLAISSQRQGRPLADWTDCFQAGPTAYGSTRYTPIKLCKLTIETSCVARAAGPTDFFERGPVGNEIQSKQRVFQHPHSS